MAPADLPLADAAAAPSARRVRATVMFASLTGFTALSESLGTERAYLIVTGCLRLLDGVARKHGGSVDKFLGDALMAVFGHPAPVARPARAAVQAALEMRRQVHAYDRELALSLPLDLQIGIATGFLVAGDIGSRVVREFHVLGDTVNVAARLKSKAPLGSIYVSRETFEEAGEGLAFRTIPPLRLKGKSQPVPAWEALDAPAPALAHGLAVDVAAATPLIGRDSELAQLRERLRRLAAGRGGVLALRGEEGLGKTRLLAELAKTPEIGALTALAVHPADTGAATDFGIARHLLAGLGGKPDADFTASALAAALRDGLARACRERPLLVACDDLQLADEGSLAVLAELLPLAAEHPLSFLLASRAGSPQVATLWTRVRALPAGGFEEIALAPLAAEAADQLLDAAAGEAPLSPAARALLLARAAGNPGRLLLGVHLAPSLVVESDHAARSERSSEAERRRATILFADITGFTAMTEKLGAEAAYPIVAGCLALLDEVARQHGGAVDKYMGDCVMATFGVPEAIEDAPRAAINAAIEMRQRLRDYNRERQLPMPLDVHVGIHSGLGIAGDISGPLLREFAVMGEPVDLAAKLTDLANAGQIFVSGETQRFTRDMFEFAPVAGAALPRAPSALARSREARDAEAVFELRSERGQLHRERVGAQRRVFSELVGRDAELTELRARLAALRDGCGGSVALVAEAGLGKSRLVAELLASAQAQDLDWREGRSISTGRNLRYHPFADLCRAWAAIEDDDDDETARARLETLLTRLFAEETAATLPLVAGVLGMRLDAAQRERIGKISGDALEKLFRRALTEMFRRASRARPMIVVMDDLHWADDSSIALLESLLPLAIDHPILFVSVMRPGFAATSERLLDAARATAGLAHVELRLSRLSQAAARQLVNNLFEADGLPHATRAAIEQKAQGNPFYIEEVVRSLVDEGAIEQRDGRFRATEKIHAVEIPATIHEVVLARVDRLGLRKKSLLQLASVIGRSFHQRVLSQVVEDGESLAAALAELESAEFIVPWDQTRGIEWAFKHPLIQEVTYDALLETRREELHREVGRAIESALSDEIPGYAGMLAYHYSKGRESERAEEYLFRAGEEAAHVAASSEALQFFREASQLYLELHGDGGDPAKKALLEKKLGLALYHRGQLIEADQHFNGALRLLGERVPRGQRALILRFARNLLAVLGGLYLPVSERRRPASEKDRDVIDLMMKRAEAQTTASPARFLFDSMDTLARLDRVQAASVPGAGGMFAGAVGIFSYGGVSFALSRRFLARARRLVRAADVSEYLSYRVMNFLHHLLAGDWSEAHTVDDALLEQGLHYGRLWEVTNALNLEGLKRAYQGDFAGARERIERLGKLADQYQHALAASAGQFLTALLHLERRELREALPAFDHYADEHPEAAFRISALGHRAAVQWLRGDATGAEASLVRAGRLVAEAGRVLPYHLSSYLRSRYLLDVHQLEAAAGAPRATRLAIARRASRSRKAALASAARVSWRGPEVLRAAGTHAWLLGRRRAARARWRESLACAERLGMRAERARTQAEMARRLLARAGAQAGAQRDEALALLAAARLEFDALALEAELRELPEIAPD